MPIMATTELIDQMEMSGIPLRQSVHYVAVSVISNVVVRAQRILHQIP